MAAYGGLSQICGLPRGSCGVLGISQDTYNSFMTTVSLSLITQNRPCLAWPLLRARFISYTFPGPRDPRPDPLTGLLWTIIVLLVGCTLDGLTLYSQ